MRNKTKTSRLPKEFKKYFWDVDFKSLSVKKYPRFVIERIMSMGDLKAVRWMFGVFRKDALKRFVVRHGQRMLDKRSNNFWRSFFGLPKIKPVKGALWPY